MRENFVQFCAFITGFSAIELEGTGVVNDFSDLLHQILGDQLSPAFDEMVSAVAAPRTSEGRDRQFQKLFLPSDVFWPVVEQLISLWYIGMWTALPDEWYEKQGRAVPSPGSPGSTGCPSASAYIEQLSYRAALAHPPGAKPTGYGSWSMPPVI